MTDTPSGIEQREVEAIVDEFDAIACCCDDTIADPMLRAATALTTLLTGNARLRAMVQPSEGLGR